MCPRSAAQQAVSRVGRAGGGYRENVGASEIENLRLSSTVQQARQSRGVGSAPSAAQGTGNRVSSE